MLADLSAKNALMVFLANLILKEAAKNGYKLSEQVKHDHLEQQRKYRGSCVIEAPYPRA